MAKPLFYLRPGSGTPAPVNTVEPSLDNITPAPGETITLNHGTWDNNPTSFAYQWYSNDGSGFLPIVGETGQTYVVGAFVGGTEISATVVATNSGGSSAEIGVIDLAIIVTVVDALLDFAGQTIGANLSTATLGASTHGTLGAWSMQGSPAPPVPGQFTFQAGQVTRHTPFKVGSTIYPSGSSASQRIVLNSPSSFKYAFSTFPASKRILCAAGFLKIGAAFDEFSLYDLFRVSGQSTGHAYVMQLDTNSGGIPGAANFKVGIECTITGATIHSTYSQVPRDTWLWGSLYCNYNTGACNLSMFTASTGALLFNVNDITGGTGEDIGDVRIGNAEEGDGPMEYGEWVFDYTSPPTVIRP